MTHEFGVLVCCQHDSAVTKQNMSAEPDVGHACTVETQSVVYILHVKGYQ